MSVWRRIGEQRAGYLFDLSDSIAVVEARHPDLLVAVSSGSMIVASDYSGQHKEATHEAYSFVVTTDGALNAWLPSLKVFRDRWLPDGRRISFKKLNEPVRWRALPSFLDLAGNLEGNLITILVDRRVGSFMLGGPSVAKEAFVDCFPANAGAGTIEKMLRLASFVSMILSGFRREDQLSFWISDHDEALDSYEKRELFGRLSTYLTFGVTGWRCPANHIFGTTETPDAPYWSEDLAAVADLAAGAYCQMSPHLPAFLGDVGEKTWQVRMASTDVESLRARTIGDWLAKGGGALRHLLLRLELDINLEVRASAQAFRARQSGT
ncbi:hypothetical protein IVB46_25850 [Bradyrhizobium sp. 61]|uniref:hypothetical protein n=1 Tax=unclassified Bradyrhizobium TaxID=2631580 RepID=UPI001FF73D64|nr:MULTISPECIES: hypothetical protein [unclassified Bradyrhizobium]MCK1278654.1 hypothetical protein [Bradyrhizobium sp. 61]MCK1446612.1 hypothetical protein [Bradyrhizobium sp. 48]MCK1461498.1 hypothetical protein [Bradyrhizobium sp. 2]